MGGNSHSLHWSPRLNKNRKETTSEMLAVKCCWFLSWSTRCEQVSLWLPLPPHWFLGVWPSPIVLDCALKSRGRMNPCSVDSPLVRYLMATTRKLSNTREKRDQSLLRKGVSLHKAFNHLPCRTDHEDNNNNGILFRRWRSLSCSTESNNLEGILAV